jgi:hypothetical protein
MPEKTLDQKLTEIAAMGEEGLAILEATAEVIRALGPKEEGGNIEEVLTGDPVADAAILRAMGVEKVIKNKYDVDIEQVLGVLELLVNAFTTVSAFYKG